MRGRGSSSLLVALVWLLLAPAAYARPGDLDAGFGNGGIVDFITPDDKAITAGAPIALQPDGKVIVLGQDSGGTGSVLLERFGADGRLDSTFGNGGVVLTDVGLSQGETPALARQPDGRILVAGRYTSYPDNHEHAVLVRYQADGRLDDSFGSGGKVVRPGGGAQAIALEPDGRILIGTRSDSSGAEVVRFKPNGVIDPSFGSGGAETFTFGGDITWMTLQSDGRILFGDGWMVRLQPNGGLDDSFGDHGQAQMPEPSGAVMQAVEQGDGRIVVAGRTADPYEMRVWRLMPDGSGDASFGGTGGVAIPATAGTTQYNPPQNQALAVAVQSNGDVLATGANLDGDRGAPTSLETVRLTPAGQLDPSFGDGGRVLTPLAHVQNGIADAIALQPDGNVMIGAFGAGDGTGHIVLARYEGDPPGANPQPAPGTPTQTTATTSSPSPSPSRRPVSLSIAVAHGQTLRSIRRHGLVISVKASRRGSVRIDAGRAHKAIRVRGGNARRVVLRPAVSRYLMVRARLRAGGKTLASVSRRVHLR